MFLSRFHFDSSFLFTLDRAANNVIVAQKVLRQDFSKPAATSWKCTCTGNTTLFTNVAGTLKPECCTCDQDEVVL